MAGRYEAATGMGENGVGVGFPYLTRLAPPHRKTHSDPIFVDPIFAP